MNQGEPVIDIQQINLNIYSLTELRLLNNKVADQISAAETKLLEEARCRIYEIAREAGIPIEQLMANPSKERRSTSIYVNPDDEKQTWNGIGRKPAWIKVWLDVGIPLADLRA
jgi:DNA-binding protein H-NS